MSAATDAINGERDDPLSHTDGQFGTCREGPRAPPDFHTGTLRTQRQFQADCGFLSGLSVLYLAQMPRALALLTKINQLAGSCHEQLKTQSLSYRHPFSAASHVWDFKGWVLPTDDRALHELAYPKLSPETPPGTFDLLFAAELNQLQPQALSYWGGRLYAYIRGYTRFASARSGEVI